MLFSPFHAALLACHKTQQLQQEKQTQRQPEHQADAGSGAYAFRKNAVEGGLRRFEDLRQHSQHNQEHEQTPEQAQPARVIVPLKPTSSLASWYSKTLERRRSMLRLAASSSSRQRIASSHERRTRRCKGRSRRRCLGKGRQFDRCRQLESRNFFRCQGEFNLLHQCGPGIPVIPSFFALLTGLIPIGEERRPGPCLWKEEFRTSAAALHHRTTAWLDMFRQQGQLKDAASLKAATDEDDVLGLDIFTSSKRRYFRDFAAQFAQNIPARKRRFPSQSSVQRIRFNLEAAFHLQQQQPSEQRSRLRLLFGALKEGFQSASPRGGAFGQ